MSSVALDSFGSLISQLNTTGQDETVNKTRMGTIERRRNRMRLRLRAFTGRPVIHAGHLPRGRGEVRNDPPRDIHLEKR